MPALYPAQCRSPNGLAAPPGSAATADILDLGVQLGIFIGEQIASLAR
jgi:hypothetical protein